MSKSVFKIVHFIGFSSTWNLENFVDLLDVGNNRHGTDVVLEVHNGPHLFDGKVDLSLSKEMRRNRKAFIRMHASGLKY